MSVTLYRKANGIMRARRVSDDIVDECIKRGWALVPDNAKPTKGKKKSKK